MSSRIHHATAKKAKKFGIELVAVENEFEARKDGKTLACHASASVAFEKAIKKLSAPKATAKELLVAAVRKINKPKKAKTARDEDESDEEIEEIEEIEEDEPEEGRSIVKHRYKQAYKARPLKISCSDDLAVQIAKHLKVKDEGGKLRVDAAKMKKFAQANGCWSPDYAKINIGLQRMSIVNRLRAKIRRDKHTVVWA